MKEGNVVTALKEGNVKGMRYVDFRVENTNGTAAIVRYIEAKHIESSNPSAINRNIIDAQQQIAQSAFKDYPASIEINLNSTDISLQQAVNQVQRMQKLTIEVTLRKGTETLTIPKK